MVSISKQGQEIVQLCELKVVLQSRAEVLTDEAQQILRRLKEISDEQFTLLQNMRDIDMKIEYLAKGV